MKHKVDWCLVRVVRDEVIVDRPEVAGEYLLKHVFTPFEQFEQEEFWVFALNSRRRITHQIMVYRGTITDIQVRPAELFRTAIRLNACSVLFAHNHPSGEVLPSSADMQMHERLCQAGEILGIEVVDHLVVGRDAWTSLRQLSG